VASDPRPFRSAAPTETLRPRAAGAPVPLVLQEPPKYEDRVTGPAAGAGLAGTRPDGSARGPAGASSDALWRI